MGPQKLLNAMWLILEFQEILSERLMVSEEHTTSTFPPKDSLETILLKKWALIEHTTLTHISIHCLLNVQYNETEVATFSVIWLKSNGLPNDVWGFDSVHWLFIGFWDKGVTLKNGARWTQAGKGWGLSGLNQKFHQKNTCDGFTRKKLHFDKKLHGLSKYINTWINNKIKQ